MNDKKITVVAMTTALILLVTFGVFFLTRSAQEENPKPDPAPVEQPKEEGAPPKEIPKQPESTKTETKAEKEEPAVTNPEKEEPSKTDASLQEEAVPVQGVITSEQQEETKKEEESYFSFANQPSSISLQVQEAAAPGNPLQMQVQDPQKVKAILDEVTSLQGKKEEASLTANTHEWTCTLTVPISDTVSNVYNLWEDYNAQDTQTSLLEVAVQTKDSTGAAHIKSKGIYRAQKSIKTMRGLVTETVNKTSEINCFSSGFLQGSIQADQVILCDNNARQSVDVSTNRLDIFKALSQLKVLNQYTSGYIAKTGKAFPGGVDQLRLKNFSTSFFTYTFYEKGVLVQSYDKEDTFYECAAEELKILYQLTSTLYQKSEAVPSWLGIMSLKNYDSMQMYGSVDGQKRHEGLIYEHSIDLFAALQNLHIQKGSMRNLKYMPSEGTYYIEMTFKTGVVYTINIQGNNLSIESSDIPDILQYTLLMDASYEQFIGEVSAVL